MTTESPGSPESPLHSSSPTSLNASSHSAPPHPTTSVETTPPIPSPSEAASSFLWAIWEVFRPFSQRVLSGLVLALPLVLTLAAMSLLYRFIRYQALEPLAFFIAELRDTREELANLPDWWVFYVAPLIALAVLILTLYLLGLVLQTRLYAAIEWIVLRLPLVRPTYRAMRALVSSLDQLKTTPKSNRVVLVPFPHPGMKSPALVTRVLTDQPTGERILCVCILTGVMPPAGFTLLIPERDATDTNLTLQDTVQAIVSGGITLPETVIYHGPRTRSEPLAAKPTDRRT